MPFLGESDTTDPKVEIRQVGPNAFQLMKGFRYREPGTNEPTYVVKPHDLTRGPENRNSTDLASVPPYLWWFVASHGRHTRPAVMHDQLIFGDDREDADRLFRVSLEEVGVSFLRRWLMWLAVSLATTWEVAKRRLVGFVTHLVLFFAALVFVWVGQIHWSIPAALGVLGFGWGFRIWPLSVAGVLIVGPATVMVWLTIGVVWLVDGVAFIIGRMMGTNPPSPTAKGVCEEGEF